MLKHLTALNLTKRVACVTGSRQTVPGKARREALKRLQINGHRQGPPCRQHTEYIASL